MKKTLLLASAAVLFAGSAQAMDEGLKLGIEGYASVYGAYADQDSEIVLQETGNDNVTEFNLMKELELAFTGETTLENGLTVGVTMEVLEDEGGSDSEVHESYAFVEGGFGKLIIGQEYQAAYLMQVAAPAVDSEIDGMDPTYDIIESGANDAVNGSYAMNFEQFNGNKNPDSDSITYISPVWSGFQFGATYTPDIAVNNNQYLETDTNTEAYSVAARYAYAHEDFDLTLGAGYNEVPTFDSEQWNIAAVAEFDAWTVGAVYYDEDDDGDEADAIALGVNYENGNFTYGISYLDKERTGEELERYMDGVNYAYGPGMTLNASIGLHEYTDDDDSPKAENDATVIALGTVINF